MFVKPIRITQLYFWVKFTKWTTLTIFIFRVKFTKWITLSQIFFWINVIKVHDPNDDKNWEFDDGETETSPESISQVQFLKCFRYLWSLQIVMATINGD